MEQDKNERVQDQPNNTEETEEQGPPYSYPAWIKEEEQEGWFEECPPGLNGLASSDPLTRSMAMVEYQFHYPGERDYALNVAQTYISYGLTDFKSNAQEKALFWFERSIAFLTPQQLELRATAHFYAGKTLSNMQRYSEALLALDEALRLDPDPDQRSLVVNIWFEKGQILFTLGRYEEALTAYDQALAIAIPHGIPCAGVLLGKGNTLDMLESREEALEAYTAALKRSPQWDMVYYNRAIVLFNMQRYADALADFEQALELGMRYPRLFVRQAQTLNLLGRSEEAQAVVEEYFSRDSLLRILSIEEILQLHFVSLDALINYDQAIEGDFLSPWIVREAALALYEVKHQDDALRVLEQGFERWPRASLFFWTKAEVLEKLQRFDEALEAIEKADEIEPENPTILAAKMRILAHQ